MDLSLKSSLAAFCAGLSVAIMPAGGAAATFHVAPQGSDANPGTQAQPFLSLGAARDAARKAGAGPHTLKVASGDYYLEQTDRKSTRLNSSHT